MFSYPSIFTYVLGAQKNRLIETVLLSTNNICLGWEIRKLNFRYPLLTKVLVYVGVIEDILVHHMGHDSTKPVFEVSDKARLKPVSSATETS